MTCRFPWLALSTTFLAGAAGCAPYHVYWGDVHGHTAYSDGKGTVEEYLSHARDVAHLDFVIVTDHDFGNAHPWWMPQEAWTHTQAAANAFTANGEFVAIAGYEWTSQHKYWSGVDPATPSERLFEGPPMYYNHKNVYFPAPVPYLFSAKDRAFMTPDLLAAAVRKAGGLAHNNHPDASPEGRDQWDYNAESCQVIANTEIEADVVRYEGKEYETKVETTVREYLNRGGRTGFVKGSDTHEGKPAARTAVLARELTREAIFEALRSRRTYGISHGRILLDFKINGHSMGEDIEIEGKPRISVDVRGTARIEEVLIIRDGAAIQTLHPEGDRVRFEHVDDSFPGGSYYYIRVTQTDTDEHGNPSRAWSSPIWVRAAESSLERIGS